MMHFWKNPIYPLLSAVLALGQSLRHFLDKITWWHFQSTSIEVSWPKKNLNYMHGLKSAILANFQKGLRWPCPVLGHSKTHHSIWKNLFVLGFYEYQESAYSFMLKDSKISVCCTIYCWQIHAVQAMGQKKGGKMWFSVFLACKEF